MQDKTWYSHHSINSFCRDKSKSILIKYFSFKSQHESFQFQNSGRNFIAPNFRFVECKSLKLSHISVSFQEISSILLFYTLSSHWFLISEKADEKLFMIIRHLFLFYSHAWIKIIIFIFSKMWKVKFATFGLIFPFIKFKIRKMNENNLDMLFYSPEIIWQNLKNNQHHEEIASKKEKRR
jgi:hypothetical protein